MATLRPSRSTVIRSAASKMSWRLWEMRTTASPCSASRRTRSSTCRVWATPSAAVGSSRMTMREFHITARPIATDWRWPPDRLATCCRIERMRRHGEALQHLPRPRFHLGLLEAEEDVVRLTTEVHVLDDVEVVAEREVLVDDLDAEPGRVLRAVDRDLLPVRVHLALVHRVDPGDALDERRLAGAVVADERHDLAGPHLEVDVVEREDRAEALRDASRLEPRRHDACG